MALKEFAHCVNILSDLVQAPSSTALEVSNAMKVITYIQEPTGEEVPDNKPSTVIDAHAAPASSSQVCCFKESLYTGAACQESSTDR